MDPFDMPDAEQPGDREPVERFNVVIYDEEGYWDYAERNVSADKALDAVQRLITLAADPDSDIDRVMITDEDDNTTFLWTYDEGLVFPTEKELGP